MEQESQKRKLGEANLEPQNKSILYANNCGFFRSANTNNLCSKCYKKYLLKHPKCPNEDATNNNDQIIENPEKVQEDNQVSQVGERASSEKPEKRLANRCSFCKKRVGLTEFKCRCEQTFFSRHRYSDKHNCVFDYKSTARDAIAKANIVVKVDKVEKI